MLIPDSFDWIFFDCFNTLIDDFDETGDESGLAPMYHVPVEVGLYESTEAFRQDYHRWRKANLSGKAKERTLQERMRLIFQTYRPDAEAAQVEQCIQTMAAQFAIIYPQTLRLPPGVAAMLDYWQGRVKMGVVSNFFLANWPEQFLTHYGLRQYFDFVLDSAACGWRKPGLEIYQVALAQTNVSDLSRVLFIGDHLRNDMMTPMRLGMQAVHFDRSNDRPNASPSPANVLSIDHWEAFRL
ncbi:MAG: HAD family hydrolase [Leptolyngbya sp. SIO4C1]|nr:HAD family hydrolase [Leptolyngbya sp. SIO4C1]